MKPLQPFEIPLNGLHLVEASAGTGKTYSIASLYIRALLETPSTVEQILVVTYTEAATAELRDRLIQRIRSAIRVLETGETGGDDFSEDLLEHTDDSGTSIRLLKEALHGFDRAAIHTIHGFCNQVLQRQAFESRAMFDVEMVGDDSELVAEAVDDYWRSWVAEATEYPLRRPLLRKLTDSGIGPDKLASQLAPYVAKPWLKVEGGEGTLEDVDRKIYELGELYREMQEEWDREEISDLLRSSVQLSNYRDSYIEKWTGAMDRWLQGEVTPLQAHERMEKLSQSCLENSLKKNAVEGAPQHPFFRKVDRYLEEIALFDAYPVIFRRKVLEYLRREMDLRKEDRQVFSFDDLLLKVQNALREGGTDGRLATALRNRYPLALVDEFQDTDPVQYDIFRLLYGEDPSAETALFMIGDPKQSIYSFRGADIFTYLRAGADVTDGRVWHLDRNFRSVPELIGAVNAIFGRHPNPFVLDRIGFMEAREGREHYARFSDGGATPAPLQFVMPATDGLPVTRKGTFRVAETRNLAAATAADEICRLLNDPEAKIGDRSISGGDIAVIVRSHSEAELVSGALQERGIHSVEFSKTGVFSTQEAVWMHQILSAVARPGDHSLVRSALCTPPMGYSGEDLLEMEETEEEWARVTGRFRSWHEAWQQHGIGYLVRRLMLEGEIAARLIGRPGGERSLTNLLHLSDRLQEEQQRGRSGTRSLLKWMVRKREGEVREQEEDLLRLESDENLVRIVTMHRSKGLEYPVVFCPFMWAGAKFRSTGDPVTWHRDGEAILDLAGTADPDGSGKRTAAAWEELAESIRLAYVALTRAQQRCYVTWLPVSHSEFSPLGYLLDDPEHTASLLQDIVLEGRSYSPSDPGRYAEAIRRLAEEPGITCVKEAEVTDGRRLEGTGDGEHRHLRERTFRRPAPAPSFSISSFSALTAGSHEYSDLPGYEYQFETEGEPEMDEPAKERTIFSFPRGPEPGTCIHNILEEVTFGDLPAAESAVEEQLRRFGISTGWKPVVTRMLETLEGKRLTPACGDPFALREIDPSLAVPEMEFWFRSGRTEAQRLVEMIRGGGPVPLDQIAPEGFMKGFIDLTFRHGERFYLADYKTNHLGDSAGDYRREKLKEEIESSFYDLQYHIYTVALHRYLRRRIPGYDYDTHFGGIWYLFLRGINGSGEEGIWHVRPERSMVNRLDRYLAGEYDA